MSEYLNNLHPNSDAVIGEFDWNLKEDKKNHRYQ